MTVGLKALETRHNQQQQENRRWAGEGRLPCAGACAPGGGGGCAPRLDCNPLPPRPSTKSPFSIPHLPHATPRRHQSGEGGGRGPPPMVKLTRGERAVTRVPRDLFATNLYVANIAKTVTHR